VLPLRLPLLAGCAARAAHAHVLQVQHVLRPPRGPGMANRRRADRDVVDEVLGRLDRTSGEPLVRQWRTCRLDMHGRGRGRRAALDMGCRRGAVQGRLVLTRTCSAADSDLQCC
jgi:hypothetical protein